MSEREEPESASPSFGEASVDNCEREQIHLPGSIQPHGALLGVDEDLLTVSHASLNAGEMLGFAESESLFGLSLDTISKNLADEIRALTPDQNLSIPMLVTTLLDGDQDHPFDCIVHRSASGQLILEFEPVCETDRNLSQQLKSGVDAIASAASLQSLCDVTAQLLKQALGYDRVMIYRFDADGHGHVFAEQCEPDLEPYLGNHYPASDIPRNARELYLRNRVRMLVDVDYEPVPIDPPCDAGHGSDFDMSMCQLRSMSPMHLQYLKNMKVASSLVASLSSGDALWGLIACHGNEPRRAGSTTRAAAELIAEVVGTRVSALESVTQTRVEHAVRRLDQSMIDVMAHDGDWAKALFDNAQGLLQILDATGAVLTYDGEVSAIGSVPSLEQIGELTAWLGNNLTGEMFLTENLAAADARLAGIGEDFPGVLAVSVSDDAGEFLICFRPETVRTVVWGGNPNKPVKAGVELSPRRSFAQWREILKGNAIPWNQNQISAAGLVRKSIRDIVHQIRAVRALIAHTQLETLNAQLQRSSIPGLIADPDGMIILANEALGTLVWRDSPATRHLSQIARYFEESSLASHNIEELLGRQRAWRGSATVDSTPVLVRADTVPSPDGGVLGYVVLLSDVSESRGHAAASHKNLEGVLQEFSSPAADLPDLLRVEYDNLAAAVMENARLAAMEISDGIDTDRVATMLDGIEDSVLRTSRLIRALATHTPPDA